MITPEELEAAPIFAVMPHALRARIASRSADIHVNAGETFVYPGDPTYFWTMLEGEVEVIMRPAGEERQMTTFDPGEYFGEIQLILNSASFAEVRATKPSRLMRTDSVDFHLMMTSSPEAAAIVAESTARRVTMRNDLYLSTTMSQAAIVGDRYDFACHDLRDFLSRNQISFEWLDPNEPADAEGMPPSARDAKAYPVVIFANGKRLDIPTLRELAEGLNLQTCPSNTTYDVAIVGGGPAGLAAAVYGGSEGLRTIMIEREAPGGQAGTSSRIENYLGFPSGVSGGDLANRALLQAKRFGTEILVTRNVESIDEIEKGHCIALDGGDQLPARAIVIATGVTWRALDAEGAAELVGRGVYYGAARTEALGTSGKDVFLIGGGNSAGQAAMFFSNYARSVTILIRGAALSKTMSFYLIRQLGTKANIAVETGTVVTRVLGGGHIESIVTRDASGAEQTRECDGLFVFIGADAETGWIPHEIERDARGYIRTGRDIEHWPLERAPFPLETSLPGIFAAGDVRSASVKRVASSVGEGSMVIAYIHEYLAALDGAPAA